MLASWQLHLSGYPCSAAPFLHEPSSILVLKTATLFLEVEADSESGCHGKLLPRWKVLTPCSMLYSSYSVQACWTLAAYIRLQFVRTLGLH